MGTEDVGGRFPQYGKALQFAVVVHRSRDESNDRDGQRLSNDCRLTAKA